MNKLDATIEKKAMPHSLHYSLDNKDQGWNVAAIGQRIREMSTHYALVFKALDTSCNCEIKYCEWLYATLRLTQRMSMIWRKKC